jgi:hypothetical protein
VRGDSTC